MKLLLFLLGLTISLFSAGQKKETFYDFNWKPCVSTEARYYSTVEKTDSGWLRKDYFVDPLKLQMQVLYEDEACKIANGHMYYFHANGNPSVTGQMVHGRQEGICLRYHSNGMMMDSATYHNGRAIGDKLSWHRNGYMSDSIAHVNDSMDVHIGWFDDGVTAFAGYLLYGKEYSKWQYFHHTGGLAATIIYNKGIEVDKKYFNEDGSPLTDTSQVNREASFAKGGLNGWRKYLEKKLYWPTGYKFSNGNQATVGISFVINEHGRVEDVEVSAPFHPVFDKMAVQIIKDSPAWIPAVLNNRKVKSWHIQPVTFAEREE